MAMMMEEASQNRPESVARLRDERKLEGPALLIRTRFQSNHWLLGHLPVIKRTVFPIGSPVSFEIYFKNLTEHPVPSTEVGAEVQYPDRSGSRAWKMEIPGLVSLGDTDVLKFAEAFFPKMAGNHRFIIEPIPGVQLARSEGSSDNRYEVMSRVFAANFYVPSDVELGTYLLVFLTLMASLISLAITLAS